ncbi:MAG: hypothetical protein AB1421_09295 [Pseudomonadota bacterium]
MNLRPRYFPLIALLVSSLSCAPQVWSASQPGAGKARAKLAQSSKRLIAQVPRPVWVTSQGMALALSTELRMIPASPVISPALVGAAPAPAPGPVVTSPPVFSVPVWTGNPRFASGAENPYLPRPVPPVARQVFGPIQAAPDPGAVVPPVDLGRVFSGLGAGIPLLPESGRSILPTVKKVYPTGEKPLVVVSFKCPTEVIGVTPPTIKLLHDMVDLGMEGLNRTDLLSFNLQQVCQ